MRQYICRVYTAVYQQVVISCASIFVTLTLLFISRLPYCITFTLICISILSYRVKVFCRMTLWVISMSPMSFLQFLILIVAYSSQRHERAHTYWRVTHLYTCPRSALGQPRHQLIQHMGRWTSDVIRQYICIP